MQKRILGILTVVIGIVAVFFILFAVKKAPVAEKKADKTAGIADFIKAGKLDEAREALEAPSAKGLGVQKAGRLYLELASAYEQKGEKIKARDIYYLILEKYPNIDDIGKLEGHIGDLYMDILFSPLITEDDVAYVVEPGDTLSRIAKKFGTTVDLIKASNGLKSDIIHPGDRLKVSRVKYRILIDKSQNILTLLTEDGRFVKVYSVGTGKDDSTPVGTFKIVNKLKDPVWYKAGAIVPAESPDNILGSRWLGFSIKGYGIHGTTDPKSIGQHSTSGCIRMYDRDVKELYTIVTTGTEVTIVD